MRLFKQHNYLEDRAKAEKELEEKEKAAAEDVEEEEEEEEEIEEEEDLSEEYEELLETIKDAQEQNNGRLDDQLVIKFFREKLISKPCQNQGFIIDGFPKTMEQAKDLFARKLHELVNVLERHFVPLVNLCISSEKTITTFSAFTVLYCVLCILYSALEVFSRNALYKFTFYITLHYIVFYSCGLSAA